MPITNFIGSILGWGKVEREKHFEEFCKVVGRLKD
jgi:hypothetical protein